ncbi:MAG: class I SAM-dependent methyltransferase [Actinobacteria bacterium]|nr:class I SAM-dependent methyltransferase [Actinomycetota bacterium]
MATDWAAWHEAYDDPSSARAARLRVVQGYVRDVLDSRLVLECRVLSLCAGTGLDLLGVLASHPAKSLVRGRLVELDSGLAATAREGAKAAGLEHLEVVVADAGSTDSYLGAVPADLVLACGVFGNISDGDVEATVHAMRSVCGDGGTVIWTRHRRQPDLTPAIRRWFAEAGFVEQGFTTPGLDAFAVGVQRLAEPPLAFAAGQQLFTFVR